MDKAEKLKILAMKADEQRVRQASRSKSTKQRQEEYYPDVPRRGGLGAIIGNLVSLVMTTLRLILVFLKIAVLAGVVYGLYHGYKWAYAHYDTDELWSHVLLSAIILDGCAGLLCRGWRGLVLGLMFGAGQAAVGVLGGPILFILNLTIPTIFGLNEAVVTLVTYSIFLFSVPLFLLAVGLSDR